MAKNGELSALCHNSRAVVSAVHCNRCISGVAQLGRGLIRSDGRIHRRHNSTCEMLVPKRVLVPPHRIKYPNSGVCLKGKYPISLSTAALSAFEVARHY